MLCFANHSFNQSFKSNKSPDTPNWKVKSESLSIEQQAEVKEFSEQICLEAVRSAIYVPIMYLCEDCIEA